MAGRPGKVKSKGSEASTSQDGDTPKSAPGRKRGGGRPRKSGGPEDSLLYSEFSRESTPFSPTNPPCLNKRTPGGETQLINLATEFDTEEDFRSHRLARFIAENPDCREELAKLQEERPSFPPWIEEKDVIEHDGVAYSTGDIVCLFDDGTDECDDEAEEWERDLPYFAQIRSMINDQFMRPFAWITWLVPTRSAPERHEFDPEHFVHSLVDHKLYELECLRWVSDRPALPAYQIYDQNRAALERHRKSQLRERTLELYRAAHFESPSKGVDVLRAGDIKAIHSEEHVDELREVLEKARLRGIERRKEMERAVEAEKREEVKTEEDNTEEDKTGEEKIEEDKREEEKTEEDNTEEDKTGEEKIEEKDKSDEPVEQAEEEKEEGELKGKALESRKRPRSASQSSVASKEACESATLSAKPMED